MDFARKQLEKYGWSDGKGLGKHENGIAQALKPKLKRSVTGVGHDAAADFTEHWWSALYDKAAGNVQVEEKNGRTKKIKTKDDTNFEITNSTWRLNKKTTDNKEEYSGYFVKTVVLTEGGTKTEKLKESESEGEEDKKDVFKMTDEELFAACEGRTAHKGARFGLKATGKLSRIQAQEQKLLTEDRFNGYSHTKNVKKKKTNVSDLQVVEDMSLNSDNDGSVKKKKKKKKHCLNSVDKCKDNESAVDMTVVEGKCKIGCDVIEQDDGVRKNMKKKKRKTDKTDDRNSSVDDEIKKKNVDSVANVEKDVCEEGVENCEAIKKCKKKRKNRESKWEKLSESYAVVLESHEGTKNKKRKNTVS